MCLHIDAKEHELGDLGEPGNYKAALLDPESDKWLDAINVEIQSMKDNKVWDLVDLPPNGKTVGSKWLFKKKTGMDGVVHTYKARLVAKGFTQTYGVYYEETFSPVADIRAIRILIAIAAFYDYEIWQMDVKTSFLNEHLSEESISSKLEERELRVSCYTDAGYLTDADDLKSQTGYVFVLNGGVVDWKSTKQSIEIVLHVSDILLSQKKYILELLQSAGLSNCNPMSSPMVTSSSLSLDDNTAFSNLPFSFTDMLWKGNPDTSLEAFSDADWDGDSDDRRSMGGFAIYLGSHLISWTARKQCNEFYISSTES
ncbi:putative retrotransposon ty1-copia subclass protein [Tanacetum coccineum]